MMKQVVPGLRLGSLASLSQVDSTKHWTVISILESPKLLALAESLLKDKIDNGCCAHVTWNLADKPSAPFLSSELKDILDLIDSVLQKRDSACLVHCVKGISRSVATIAAWMISSRQKESSLAEALDTIRSTTQPDAIPNMGFLASLRALEQCDGDVDRAIERLQSRTTTAARTTVRHAKMKSLGRHNPILMFCLLAAILCFQMSASFSLAATHLPPSSSVSVVDHQSCAISNQQTPPPPIVYTIAGSDSGGGAGIQADLHAIHAMGCHGCSAITCLTAQNSMGVTGVYSPPPEFLQQQLETLANDLHPKAVKIGMLGNRELAEVVGTFLKELKQQSDEKIWVVLDPVMISTSGSKLLEEDAIEAMIEHIFPLADVITPNKFEAEALLERKLKTPEDVQEGAKELLKMGCRAVLIKGGHTLVESSSSEQDETPTSKDVHKSTLEFSQDYLLSSGLTPPPGKERLCDACRGVWLRTPRWDSENTHGTGCTLSSAIASALALGEDNRQSNHKVGAKSSIEIVDACCLAKAYVSAGIQKGVQLGSGPGPVAQTAFPGSYENFPSIVTDPTAAKTTSNTNFFEMRAFSQDDRSSLGRILPIVDTAEWVEKLSKTEGITDVQLRIKDEKDLSKIAERVKTCQGYCQASGVRLWINDHWRAAIEAGCFGVHVGQEDLFQCVRDGGVDKMMDNNVALGISTHSYGELATALGIKPSYISMGPVFATSSKKVEFDPQGLETVRQWKQLIPSSVPFVTIGGINDLKAAQLNRKAGADCIAVISAITGAQNPAESVAELNNAMK